VVHHGALGSFAVVHVPEGVAVNEVRDFLLLSDGITEVYTRDEAARKLELAADRLGDLVVCSGRDLTLGRTPAHHDLSVLRNRLRSHGGRYEEMVPFIFSHPLTELYQEKLRCDPRNFDIFDYLLNGMDFE
jgi:phosphonoacetate hydrolase